MRFVAVVLALLATLSTGVLPCHRCMPVGGDGVARVVVLGTHAHAGDRGHCSHATRAGERHAEGHGCSRGSRSAPEPLAERSASDASPTSERDGDSLGEHAHEDGCGGDPQGPCCVDSPVDGFTPLTRCAFDGAALASCRALAPLLPPVRTLVRGAPAQWREPVPRRVTETVVLLR